MNLLIKISWKQPKSSLLFKSAVSSLEPNSFRVLFEKKLLPYILFQKCVYILALEMASPGNQHCANYIGTLLFPMSLHF